MLYKLTYDGGCNSWEDVEDIFLDREMAEWELLELEEVNVDDYISYYIKEWDVNTSTP